MALIRIKRGTRAQLDAAKTANQLAAGEPYLVTDEDALAIGTAADAYTDISGGEGVTVPSLPALALPDPGDLSVVWDTSASALKQRSAEAFVVLGADVVNNNGTANTLADVTGLSFAVASGVRYAFHFEVNYTSAATTTGSRWTLNGPSTSGLVYTSRYTLTATTGTVNYVSAYNAPSASNASSLTAGNLAIIEGFLVPSAAGTLIVRCASEVASSAITAKAGSWGRLTPLS